jgi:CheY-like chemotaxis protein
MQSLLFCQDEKSARALIPLVQGLDIVVKHETDVFSAVRSLTAEPFDFLIIDYADEHTGRVLLKNARSSPINKAALAVAVVDLETGANALRLGADFLLTRPIRLEQAEGVLRLVRSTVLRSRRVSSSESATQVTAAEPMQQVSIEDFSDGQATPFKAPTVEPEKVTAKFALDATTGESEQTGDGQNRDLKKTEERLPLKDKVRIAPQPSRAPVPESADLVSAVLRNAPPEIRARELPKKAATEIKRTPSHLFLVSMAAVAVILLTLAAVAWHIHIAHSLANRSAPIQSSAANFPAQSNAKATESTPGPVQVAPEPPVEEPPAPTPVAVAVVPEQLSLNPTSEGAHVDEQNNSARVAPHTRTGVAARQHRITISKPAHPARTRTQTIKATAGLLSVRADSAPLTATVSLNSDPANAAVWIDGRDSGRMTPAQISVDKPGNHTFVFKKQGYLDETTTANLRVGQTFLLAPSLHALGRTDEIKMVGKFKKIFGGGATAGMGSVTVKTQPKGAQIAINSRTISKPSPAEFYLNPGDYAIDITLSGFKVIHRVMSVDKGDKIVIDEVLDHE